MLKTKKNHCYIVAAALAAAVTGPLTHAATLTYDADITAPANDGPGAWDGGTTANWFDGTNDVVWPNTTNDTAVFGAGSGAAGTVTVNAGGVTANSITFNAPGSGAYTLSGGSITLGGTTPTITSNATATINSVVGGTAGLTKTGPGQLNLGTGNIANTFVGGVAVNEGTLSVGSSTGGAAGTAFGNANNVTLGAASGSAAATIQITRNATYLSNAQTLTIQAGTTGVLRFAGGSGLGLNQTPTLAAAITLNNNLTIGNGTNGLGGNGGGAGLSGVISDGGVAHTITIEGSQNTTVGFINGANSAMVSNIVVTKGILRLGGTGAGGTGLVSVNGGVHAALHGNSATAALGNVTVTNSSHVSPGNNTLNTVAVNGIGNLNFGGVSTLGLGTGAASTLTLTSANLDFDLAPTTAGTSDKLVTNSLALGTLTFNFSATVANGLLDTSAPYTLIDAANLPSGFDVNNITTVFTPAGTGALAFTGGPYTASYSINGTNDLVVAFSVPEPASLSLMAFAGLGLLRRRRHSA